MSNVQKERVYMLAAAGLLLCASTYGWIQHQRHIGTENASSSAATTPTPMTTAKIDVAQPSGGQVAAGSNATAGSQQAAGAAAQATEAYTVPVTNRDQAVIAAHAAAGRQDPMAPFYGQSLQRYYAGRAPAGQMVPSPPDSGLVMPPPPYPMSMAANPSANVMPAPIESRREVPLRDAVRLTGLIDGRAIFSVPRDVARFQHLPTSFTLGQGEYYRDLKLEAVDSESVTVREGSRICTKTLSSIH